MTRPRPPKHLHSTARAWRVRKRSEWQAVLEAMRAFQKGCAYTPDKVYLAFESMMHTAGLMESELRGDWIAWENFKRKRTATKVLSGASVRNRGSAAPK